jgi:hypothetical protein
MKEILQTLDSSGSSKALLNLLQESGEQECAELVQKAEQKSADIRRRAFGRARERVRLAVGQARKQMAQSLARVEAEIETAQRQRILAHDSKLVAEGRDLLKLALQRRWQQTEFRKAWAAALLDAAAQVVISRDWQIDSPSDWPKEERAKIIELAARTHGAAVEVCSCDSIDAGLRLTSGGLIVDMRVDGLMANRGDIDSALLAFYQQPLTGGGE